MSEGAVIWITGLSASGKTTLATALHEKLRSKDNRTVILDGDDLRSVIASLDRGESQHSRENRLKVAIFYSKLCRLLSSQGLTVIISTISLFNEVHRMNRESIPKYLEIFIKVPLSTLMERDPKGIYRKYNEGKIQDVIGLDQEYDEPISSELTFEYDKEISTNKMVHQILSRMTENGWVME